MIDSLRHFLNRSARRSKRNKRGGNFLSRFIRWHQRRRDVELLHGMPDYLLKDIGIFRCEIEQVTRGRREALPRVNPSSDVQPESPVDTKIHGAGPPAEPMTRARCSSRATGTGSALFRSQRQ